MNELMTKNRLTPAEAAKILGVSTQYVRRGIISGRLSFGTAVKMSSVWTYHISPKLLYEYIGSENDKDKVAP